MSLAPYMEWSKSRAAARFDLAASNLLACTLDDLPGAHEAVELAGRNDEGYAPLLAAIAARYGVEADCVAAASGCSGANFLALAASVKPGDDVLIERPAYDPLIGSARLIGANIVRFDRTLDADFAIDPDRIASAITPRTRAIVITSPHNPTGVVASDAALAEASRLAERAGAILLVDEVYLDVARECGTPPAARLGPAVVTTNSLTKSYGLSGLRCGWTIASRTQTQAIRRARDVVDGSGPFPTDRLALLAFEGLDALHARARRIVGENHGRVKQFLDSRDDLTCVVDDGSVLFPRIKDVESTDRFAADLFERHDTAVVPGRFFEMPAHFRIALGGDPAMFAAGLEAIGKALDEL